MDGLGFVVTHPFQIYFYEKMAKLASNSVLFVETRPNTPFSFDKSQLESLGMELVYIDSAKLKSLDGTVDALVCMTPVHVNKQFKKTKVIALQYSLAKETYQYGVWRSLADLNLMFGDYSLQKVSGFCTAEKIGNPRFDSWFNGNLNPVDLAADWTNWDGGKKTLLYMPTYGELSSLAGMVEQIDVLKKQYNVIVKLHHASEFDPRDIELVKTLKGLAKNNGGEILLLDGYADALPYFKSADCVISDFSGSIFDALLADVKNVTLQTEIPKQKIIRTTDDSLEVTAAQSIGPVIGAASEIHSALDQVLSGDKRWDESRLSLKENCFTNNGNASEAALSSIEDLMAGKIKRTFATTQVHDAHVRYLAVKRKLRLRTEFVKSMGKLKRPIFLGWKSTVGFAESIKRKLKSAAVGFAKNLKNQ